MNSVLLIVDNILTCECCFVDEKYFGKSFPCGVEVDIENGKIIALYNDVDENNLSDYFLTLPRYRFPPGSTLMPGFIDCHVHICGAGDNYQYYSLTTSSASKALLGLKTSQDLLQAGFTTVRSAGDPDRYYPSFDVASSIKKGDFIGPTIVGAGHYISVTGGGGDIEFLAKDQCFPCGTPLADGLVVDGRQEVLKAVRNEIKYGSDWIKLLVTGAFMNSSLNPKDSPENTHFLHDELTTAVEEAKRRKVPVMAHAHGAEGILMAIKAGARSVEHASFIDEEGIKAALQRRDKENGVWIVPTFLVGQYFSETGSQSHAQDRMIAIKNETNSRYYDCIQKAVNAGVQVALGSDYCGWDPAITAREFRYMVELGGMTEIQSIYSGTGSAADLLDISNIGRILPGNVADLVVIQGNPCDNISLLEKAVVFVMKGGKIVRDSCAVSQEYNQSGSKS
jgi:imidazolonepropionase-like amidohydrolase